MIFNWFKVSKEQEEVKEEVIVRDFVKKIAEKLKDGLFEIKMDDGDPYYSFYFKDIKISRWGSCIFLYVINKRISLNSDEENLIINECRPLVIHKNMIDNEKLRIQEELDVKEAIKTVEEYFND